MASQAKPRETTARNRPPNLRTEWIVVWPDAAYLPVAVSHAGSAL